MAKPEHEALMELGSRSGGGGVIEKTRDRETFKIFF